MSRDIMDHVATREWDRGYRFNPGDVAIIGIDENGYTGPHAFLDGSDAQGNRHSVEELVSSIENEAVPMIGEKYHRLLVLRFEEFDYQEHNGFHDQLTAALDDTHCDVVAQFKIDSDRDVYQGYMDQQWNSPGNRWTSMGKFPDVSAEMRADGHREPALNKQEFLARFTPEPQPGFQALDTQGDTRFLDMAASPKERVDFARRALAVAADPERDENQRLRAMQTVTHLADTEPLARDALAFDGTQDPNKRETLVDIYRQAPATQRIAVAAAAGSAYLGAGQSMHAAEKILEADNVLTSPDHGRLPLLLKGALTRAHMSPAEIQKQLGPTLENELKEAEQEFEPEAEARRAAYRADVQKNPDPRPQPYHSDGGWAWVDHVLEETTTVQATASEGPEVE